MIINRLILSIIITASLVLCGCITPKTGSDMELTIEISIKNNDSLTANQGELKSAVTRSSEVIMSRLKSFGLTEKSIVMEIADNSIHLKLSGVSSPERIKNLLTDSGKLGVWETYENGDVITFLTQANDYLKANKPAITAANDKPAAKDDEADEQSLEDMMSQETSGDSDADKLMTENPLFSILLPNINNEGQPVPGSVVGYTTEEDTAKVNGYLKMTQIKNLLPRDLKLIWSRKPYVFDDTKKLYELHAIKITSRDGQAPLNGSEISSAKATIKSKGADVRVSFTMNSEGADILARMTHDNIDRNIAFIMNGYVIYSPRVVNEITEGKADISSNFTAEEAIDLAAILNSGELPFEVRITQEQITKRP